MNLSMISLPILVFVVTASLMTPSSGSVIRSQAEGHLMFDYNWPQPDFKIRKYPHEKYCHYFYYWESGDLYTVRKCPKGEIFDYLSHECKEKKNAKCWSHLYGKTKGHDHIHTKLKKHFDCPFSSGKYPDVFVCEKYFVCKEGVSHQKHCPPTKLFDRIRRQCVDESVALCADITDADDIHHRCPKPSGKFGHPKDCSKYYTCKHGKRSLKNCPEGELFNDVEKYCTENDAHCGDRSNPYNPVTTSDGNAEVSKNSLSTSPDGEPTTRDISKSEIKITSKTDLAESKSESLLPVTSSAMPTIVTQSQQSTKESSTLTSKDSKKDDHEETKMNEKLSTASDKSVISTKASASA